MCISLLSLGKKWRLGGGLVYPLIQSYCPGKVKIYVPSLGSDTAQHHEMNFYLGHGETFHMHTELKEKASVKMGELSCCTWKMYMHYA